MTFRDDYRRLLRTGGFAVWVAVGLPVLVFSAIGLSRQREATPILAWVAAYLLFGLAFGLATSRRRLESNPSGVLLLLAGQTAAVLALVALPPCFGLEGALLVLVALVLGGVLPRRAAFAWILAQSAGLLAVVWLHWDWHWAVVLTFAYLPFQLIAAEATRLLAEETAARESLAAANVELRGTRELLARTSRDAERARIAREVHDLLGHNLTALSLNLEIASQLTDGDARARVETAQSVTKLLLGDLRATVGALRQSDDVDLPVALRNLAEGSPRPRIHVDFDSGLEVADREVGEVVLRCAQEIVTNAMRHARAENLWLGVRRNDGAIEIHARDDGCGAAAVRSGHGLAGMRERFEQRGGTVSIETAPGRGFEITAVLPL
ncbi:MAG TPA: sensor histidine kinase [Thermoanaerobaculia bacterium]